MSFEFDQIFVHCIITTTLGTLNKWMKKGSVDLTVTRVNMLGVPESGKTCAQLLLLGKDAPTKEVNDSTEIACPTVRAMRVAADDESTKWREITRDELLEGLAADLIKESQEKVADSGPGTVPSDDTDQSLVSSDSKDSVPSKKKEVGVDLLAEKVIQEILAKDPKGISLNRHWLYVIDSGGQPAYQELLPLFTRSASLNIITLDLSKPLDEELDMKYRINGKYFRCRSKSTQLASIQSAVSTAANFKYKAHRHSMHLVLGTHYNENKGDTLTTYEDALKKHLKPYLKSHIITIEKNSVIFPVNTVAESREERDKYRKEICQAIWMDGSAPSVTIKIPIQWFAFELSLPEDKSIISFEEAADIGKKFGMKEEDTKTALQYFHDVSLMLYYPEAKDINDLVFRDPKPILDILSQLLVLTYEHADDESTFDGTKEHNNFSLLKSILLDKEQVSKIKRNNLKDGFFYEEIFTRLKSSKIFSRSKFECSHLISLLLHLNIITKVEENEKGHYFIPYALPSYRGSKTLTVEDSGVQSLLIVWMDKNKCLPVPQGLFPLALMHLHNNKELKIDLSLHRPDSYFTFRDAMSIRITVKEIPHTLHLINRYSHIEITFTGPQEHCSEIREAVMKAVKKVTDDLHLEHNYKKAFACPNSKEECYCFVVNEDKFIVNCTDCSGSPLISESECRCWFKCSTDAPLNTSKNLCDILMLTVNGSNSFRIYCTFRSAFIGYCINVWYNKILYYIRICMYQKM